MRDEKRFEALNDAAIQDMMSDPSKYGAPTFEQFKANRDRYIAREDHLFQQVERGSEMLKSRIKKYKFEVFNYRCKTLEEAEKVIRNNGFKLSDMEMAPELIPLNSYDCDMLVKFVLKESVKRKLDHGTSRSSGGCRQCQHPAVAGS